MTWQQLWCWLGWHDFNEGYFTTTVVNNLKRIDKHYCVCSACKKKFQMSTEYIFATEAEREIFDDLDGKS